jgi:hypothetical protein
MNTQNPSESSRNEVYKEIGKELEEIPGEGRYT